MGLPSSSWYANTGQGIEYLVKVPSKTVRMQQLCSFWALMLSYDMLDRGRPGAAHGNLTKFTLDSFIPQFELGLVISSE